MSEKTKDLELSTAQKIKLKKVVKELEQYKGMHTELVSVYIPAGYDLNKIMTHLQQEQGTATNIKSSTTRKNVIDALERMIQHLKLFKKTPDNGLAVFSGNISDKPGDSDVRVWAIEPPVPLNTRIYRCDKTFVLEPLRDMAETRSVYGLIVLDRRDADIALLKGSAIIPLLHTHSEVPGKFKAGGQSAARFMRQRADALKEHYKKIAEYMKDQFLMMDNLKGIVIGGPSTTVANFLNKDFITGDVEKKIIGTFDLAYTGSFGIQELVQKSKDLLAKEELVEQKQAMNELLTLLAKEPEKVAYGYDDTKEKLIMGAVRTLLVHEELAEQMLDELEEEAAASGANIIVMARDTSEGKQLDALGKMAAILRYSV